MLKTVARETLRMLDKVLPGRASARVSDRLSAAYRSVNRYWYLRRCLTSTLCGDAVGVDRTTLVFQAMPYSLVGWKGLEATYECLRLAQEAGIQGDLVECGVARGGSAAMMAVLNERSAIPKRLWLFDSFEGLPEPTPEDYQGSRTGTHVRPLPRGSCLGTYEQVSDLLFEKLKLRRDRIDMVKGWFERTLPATRDRIEGISVLRLDGDWYASTRTCLENLYDKVVPGGYVIVDDYFSCFGCTRATDEFLGERGIEVTMFPDGRGGAYFVKPAQ